MSARFENIFVISYCLIIHFRNTTIFRIVKEYLPKRYCFYRNTLNFRSIDMMPYLAMIRVYLIETLCKGLITHSRAKLKIAA